MTAVASAAQPTAGGFRDRSVESSSSRSQAKYECSDSHRSSTGRGANNNGGYQSTCDEADFGGNGQETGPGGQTGKPCAGCVGNADDKNPPGQYPNGSDHNSGYECDGRDRPSQGQNGNGNHGVGDENPAHTGCAAGTGTAPPPPPAPKCPDGSPMSDTDGNGVVNAADCKKGSVPPAPKCPDGSPMSDTDGNGVVNAADCAKGSVPPAPKCPDGSPMSDTDGNGVVNAADCAKNPGEQVGAPEVAGTQTEANPSVVATAPAVAAVQAAAAPAEVLGEVVSRRPAAEVLGVQFDRSAGPLARTGISILDLVLGATLLLALGRILMTDGRRRTSS